MSKLLLNNLEITKVQSDKDGTFLEFDNGDNGFIQMPSPNYHHNFNVGDKVDIMIVVNDSEEKK